MLSIGKLGAGQERYYLEKVAEGAEDYYSGEGEVEGYWFGQAATDLDLHGKVEAGQLGAMLTGKKEGSGANPLPSLLSARPKAAWTRKPGTRLELVTPSLPFTTAGRRICFQRHG
jgi:hypothetical protein